MQAGRTRREGLDNFGAPAAAGKLHAADERGRAARHSAGALRANAALRFVRTCFARRVTCSVAAISNAEGYKARGVRFGITLTMLRELN